MSDEPTSGQRATPRTSAARLDNPFATWNQPISAERQAELQGYLDRWQAETDHGDRKGPFDNGPEHSGVKLSGADVSWLDKQSRHDRDGLDAWLPNLHLEGADLGVAHLEGAHLLEVHLEKARLCRAHLQGANLRKAHLEGTDLFGAYLQGTDLFGVYLQGAKLAGAHLEGADLTFAHLEGADLRGAWLDSMTVLSQVALDTMTRLGDIQWSGVGAVNLTGINWDAIPILGDERRVNLRSPIEGQPAWVAVVASQVAAEAAVRANRQLAAQLRAQGLSEVADRFAERAQVQQRKLLFLRMLADRRRPWHLPRDLARWLFSWFLALLAGYGYHPGRSVFWYLATIGGFAALYMRFGVVYGHVFNPLEAAVFSLTSFHGRGFFPGGLTLDDPVTVLAAIEAVIGLLIEISFIATFTQRFFGSR